MSQRIFAAASILALVFLLAGCSSEPETASTDDEASQAADTMAAAHDGDSPEATAAAREPVLPVNASSVPYAQTEEGKQILGYIAAPENPDSILTARGMDPETVNLPGIVVIHEWWGLNDNIRTATRRLAGEGYRVLAVDLYDGSTADTPDGARDLMETAMSEQDQLIANLKAAHAYLRKQANAPSVAVLGWCFGGGMTLAHAVAEPKRLDGAVVYYGSPRGLEEENLAQIAFPMIGFFGENDSAVPVDAVRDLDATLDQVGVEHEFYYYDAGHAFANPSGTRYDADAAADAWDKTTAFLRQTLYPRAES